MVRVVRLVAPLLVVARPLPVHRVLPLAVQPAVLREAVPVADRAANRLRFLMHGQQ